MRLDPDAAAPLRALAPLYVALDRTDDALDACKKALELDPDDADTAYFYARQLRAADKTPEAVAAFARTAALPALKEKPALRLQICVDLGALRETAGDLKRAEAAFRDAAAILDKPDVLMEQAPITRAEIDGQAAELYERLGRLCLKAGAAERAGADFEQARKKDPSRAGRLAYDVAQVYAGQGKTREALERLDEYLQTQPLGIEGYELRIALQRKLRPDADVVTDLEAASGHDPQNPALKTLLAREYHKAGRNADAERVYTELVKDAPSAEVYHSLFDLYKQDARGGVGRILDVLDAAVDAASEKQDRPGDPAAAARRGPCSR